MNPAKPTSKRQEFSARTRDLAIHEFTQPLTASVRRLSVGWADDLPRLAASVLTLRQECRSQILALMLTSTSEFLRRRARHCDRGAPERAVARRVRRAQPDRVASRGARGASRGQIDAERLYLNEIAAFPRLDGVEESRVVMQMKRGDGQALETLIKAHLGLVVMFARRYQRPGVALLDLISEGNMGLFIAAERFDPGLGFRFSTYAKWWVKRAMLMALPGLTSVVRFPIKRAERRDAAARLLLAPSWGEGEPSEPAQPVSTGELDDDAATPDELPADWRPFPLAEVTEVRHVTARARRSSPSPYGDGDALDAMAGPEDEEPSQVLLSKQLDEVLQRALDSLPERERVVVRRRFAIGGEQEKPATLDALSREFGLSKERIRQIENTGLAKLRKLLVESHVDSAV